MKFAILVNEGPYQHQASDSAYHFACAALASGHEVIRVFFYHDAVHNGSRLAAPPQDEQSIGALWATLAAEHRLDLVVCVAAAQRRESWMRSRARAWKRTPTTWRLAFASEASGN